MDDETGPRIPTVWIKAIRPHTRNGRAVAEDDIYLVEADMVETICDVLHFAVRVQPPPRAIRMPAARP